MNKEEIKQLIELTMKYKGGLTLNYVSEEILYDTEEIYNLYYGGQDKITISERYYVKNHQPKKINREITIEEMVDDIYNTMYNSVGNAIRQYLDDIGEEYELLKYFDREENKEEYEKFKKGVLERRDIERGNI